MIIISVYLPVRRPMVVTMLQVVTMLEDLKAEVVAEGTTEESNYKKFLGRRRGSRRKGNMMGI